VGNPGYVVVGQVDASQSSKAGERFGRQFRNEVLLEAAVKIKGVSIVDWGS